MSQKIQKYTGAKWAYATARGLLQKGEYMNTQRAEVSKLKTILRKRQVLLIRL